MGYNLAIEYLADPEKTWMLESFKELDRHVLQPQHRALKEWLFLEVGFNPLPELLILSPFPPSSTVLASSCLLLSLTPSHCESAPA